MLEVYVTVVLSILLYACETWTVLDQHVKRLEVFHMRCLRNICGVSLRDHVRNATILKRCSLPSIASTLRHRRLRWLGHVHRMGDCRLPKQMLYGQVVGRRTVGRPHARWHDVVRKDLDSIHHLLDWDTVCLERDSWRLLIDAVRT